MSQATKGLRAVLVGSDCPSRKTAASQGHERPSWQKEGVDGRQVPVVFLSRLELALRQAR